MKKRWLLVLFVAAVALLFMINRTSKSNSEVYSNKQIQMLLIDCEKEYNHTFQLANKEIEDKLYGKWLAEDIIGYDTSETITGDVLYKAIIDITKDNYNVLTTIDARFGGQAEQCKNPVFAYYNETFGDMMTDEMLYFSEVKEINHSQMGTVIIVMGIEESGQYDIRPERFIILGDKIIAERQQSYYELKMIRE